MRDTSRVRQLRLFSGVGALALLSSALAGCSGDVSRFDSFFDPTPNRMATMASVQPGADVAYTGSLPDTATPAPSTSVSTTTLPPVQGAAIGPAYGSGSQTIAAAPSVTDAASKPIEPGWSRTGGTVVMLRDGETIDTLSRRYSVPRDAIMKVNGLTSPSQAVAGSQVVIPIYNSAGRQLDPAASAISGQVASTGAAPSRTTVADNVYVVKPGDSLGRIANNHGMRSSELAAANNIKASDPIRIGQKLMIPANAAQPKQVASLETNTMTDAVRLPPQPARAPAGTSASARLPEGAPAKLEAAKTNPQATGLTPMPAAAALPKHEPAPETTVANVAPAAEPAKTPTAAQTGDSPSFRWPVQGRIISAFGKKPNGDRNDGINLDAPEGTPIKAAEAGTVIYSGNELKGYGNLVLIKHPNGMVSAYAHASELLVRRGDSVKRGQMIGRVGDTGSVTRPQLHFELREGNRPIDPTPYMSS
ncbi:Murein hydrolase activator NlpD precursor [Hartmannibacter diazotrophicus]|uniref:Murein hydrolase activator NlpD n=1 Tax=Hartmannibacter diazotrophicus TaxID=1482074 RepID=A0A2C9D7B1_9HYPH|nr:peptidoglycan DD-metalloendopeptidase family protein [Hartmannibacter diazotrophicus]SON56038.1 Murein hydrolase activator NlpD precursor [Hartmannibacter diazotrophicus]